MSGDMTDTLFMANETDTPRAHFLFSQGREMTFTVTGADEVTVYTGSCGMSSPWGASMNVSTQTKADARSIYRTKRAQGWTVN